MIVMNNKACGSADIAIGGIRSMSRKLGGPAVAKVSLLDSTPGYQMDLRILFFLEF